ncbi:Alpha/beta hydrolase family protein [Spironucleus salmonicida]|uniref:Alpha/beta hydrolase family protein n=1 Tax=Spironucleus salmonicida TaxID=348837 RepID=A0A9P8LLX3_9EUKA|nr:Alpha/beta hydrolase family protein [Spironucleus salmonicida]
MFRKLINKISFPADVPQQNYIKLYPDYVQQHEIKISNAKRSIYSAFVPCKTKTQKLIIYAHGNAETIYHTIPLMEEYTEKFQCNFVTFDYEGCGLSDGKPSEQALIRASELVFSKYSNDYQIIVWGRSIGSIPAAYLGKKYQLRTIIQSGLASAFHVAFNSVKTNIGNEFMNIKKVPFINNLLLLHGTRDNIVPFSNAQENFKSWIQAHPNKDINKSVSICQGMDLLRCDSCYFYIIHAAGHNDIDSSYSIQLQIAIQDFIQ